jgi:hypothetical protein
MAASNNWSVDVAKNIMPTMISSNDLFDVDMFGDELLDLYNDAVNDMQVNQAGDEQNCK